MVCNLGGFLFGLQASWRREAQPVTIAEFLAAWGNEDVRPNASFRTARGDFSWTLATQHKATTSAFEDRLVFSVETQSSKLRWQADVSTATGNVLQIKTAVPPAIRVESVSVFERGGAERGIRWTCDSESGDVTILLDSAITGAYRIAINGTMAHKSNTSLVIPCLTLLEATPSSRRLIITRQPQVLADIRTTGNWQVESVSPDEPVLDGMGSVVQVLSSSDEDSTAVVEVSRNKPSSEALQLLTVNYENDEWTADLEFRLHVRTGLVDSISFEIPVQWNGLKIIEPASSGVSLTFENSDRASMRRMTIQPSDANSG